MIYLGLNIANPWCRRWTNVWNKVYATPHPSKYLELEVFEDNTIVSLSIKFAPRQDHAGLTVEAGLLGYSLLIQLYDIRHWNDEAGRYYIYDEEHGAH